MAEILNVFTKWIWVVVGITTIGIYILVSTVYKRYCNKIKKALNDNQK